MATISEKLAREIIEKGGYYADDPRVARVVEYDNAFGGHSYAIEYEWERGKYTASHFIRNPTVLWDAKDH